MTDDPSAINDPDDRVTGLTRRDAAKAIEDLRRRTGRGA
jgi:hypothetical protein